MKLKLAGINIQFPWADMILRGLKTVETRNYDIPDKHVNKDMWLIETPGKCGVHKARVVGIIRFQFSRWYMLQEDWDLDINLHRCFPGTGFDWNIQKRGWIISKAVRISLPFYCDKMSRGIVYSSPYEAHVELLE